MTYMELTVIPCLNEGVNHTGVYETDADSKSLSVKTVRLCDAQQLGLQNVSPEKG